MNTMQTGVLLALATGTLGVSACSPEPSLPQEVVVRDSAGIRIVESTATATQPASWTLASDPQWVVGELDGDPAYLLGAVTGALEVAGDEVVIADRQTNELRFFDADGAWTRTLGGTGEGPGEFEYLRGLDPCRPGGFVAFDLNWQRNSYAMDGTFVDKTVLTTPAGITPYALACDETGRFMVLGWGRAINEGPIIGFFQAHDRLVLLDEEGGVAVDFGDRLVSERLGTTGGSGPHPAGRATRFDLRGGRAYIGSGERFEVEVWNLDGTLESLIRGPPLPLEITESVRATYLAAELEGVDAERSAALRTRIEAMEWPERLPAFTELDVDPAGVIWVKRFEVVNDGVERWSLLHPDDGYLGDLSLSPGDQLLRVGEDHLLVRMEDDLGVQRVARVPLTRAPEG